MKFPLFVSLLISSVLLAACSGLPKTSGGGGGPYTISVTVSGLTGSGLVLADNGTDKLTITATGTFPFATTIPKNGTYAVTVQTQPSNPTQTCAVNPSTGSGTATANVTVTVTCTTNPVSATIGGRLLMVIVTADEVLLPRQLSKAFAVRLNVPRGALLQISVKGLFVTSPSLLVSAKNSTRLMKPSLSVA